VPIKHTDFYKVSFGTPKTGLIDTKNEKLQRRSEESYLNTSGLGSNMPATLSVIEKYNKELSKAGKHSSEKKRKQWASGDSASLPKEAIKTPKMPYFRKSVPNKSVSFED